MKTGIRTLISVFICVLVLSACTPATVAPVTETPVPTATNAPSPTPSPELQPVGTDLFAGEWVSTDPVDGSSLALTITRGDDGSYSIIYTDDGARICGVDSAGKPKFGIQIEFTGTVRDNVLIAVPTSATCLSTPASPLEFDFSANYSYQADTDTLRDSMDQTVWKRK